MKRVIWTFGLVAALMLILFQLGKFSVLTSFMPIEAVLSGVALLFAGAGNGRTPEFRPGVRLGLGITLIPAFVFFLYIVVFFYWQEDSFLAYAAKEMDPEQAVLMEQNRALFANPFFQGAVMFLTVLLLGTVISLISALILQRKG